MARLLPRERWSRCSRCGGHVPEFEFSEGFRSQLADLIKKKERIHITKQLREVSGCEWRVAKSWVVHKTYENPQTEPDKFACPYCREPLRTNFVLGSVSTEAHRDPT